MAEDGAREHAGDGRDGFSGSMLQMVDMDLLELAGDDHSELTGSWLEVVRMEWTNW